MFYDKAFLLIQYLSCHCIHCICINWFNNDFFRLKILQRRYAFPNEFWPFRYTFTINFDVLKLINGGVILPADSPELLIYEHFGGKSGLNNPEYHAKKKQRQETGELYNKIVEEKHLTV